MSDDEKEIINILKDLIYLQSIIATELIKITENTSRLSRGEVPQSCLDEHANLEKKIIEICEKYCSDKISDLKQHVLKHE